jgi:tRNA nucleotidyltransferase (CCA-adding enzyme)
MTLIQVKEKLIGLLKENITPAIMANDIMSSPMISIPLGSYLEDARDSLARYSINAIPVIKGDMIVGILSRQVVEKALYHGLSHIGVGEYMTKDFSVVTPDTPLSEVQKKIMEGNQRLLPVMSNDRVKGVITRTDLLRSLHESLLEKPQYISGEVPPIKRLRSVKKMLTERLPNKVNIFLKEIGLVAETLGFKAYLVGGAVRDLIMRNKNLDIDIVIEGDGIIFAKKFSETFPCKVRSHQRFGTAVMIFPDGFKIDVATARLEYYEKPGALPTVELSSIKLDLYRRDFSINTLAVRLNPDGYGELLDFYGGLKDLKSKTIRVLHNLSFVEDPTRILRALRFEQKFGFAIGKQTQSLIKSTVKLNLFKSVNGGRLLTELIYILQEEEFITTLKRMSAFGVLGDIHPEIILEKKEETVLHKARDVLSWYHLLFLEEKIEEWLVIFLMLTTALDSKKISRLVRKLDIEGKHRKEIIADREKANKALKFISSRAEKLSESDLFHTLKSFPLELVIYMMIKTDHELSEKRISHFVTKLRGCKTNLTGKDVIKMGAPEGPICGEILRNLLNKKINGELKDIDQETDYVLDFLKNRAKISEASKV